MGFMPTDADSGPGGGTPREETPVPPLITPPGEILAAVQRRLVAALDSDDLPPGSIANVLSSLAKIAIAAAEIDAATEPGPQIVFIDPHADQWHDVNFVLTRALTAVMELHQQAESILGKLDEDLSKFDHAVAVRARQAIRLATKHFHTGIESRERTARSSPQPEE